MSNVPQIALGWGLTFDDTEEFIVEPRCEFGVVAAQSDDAADGSVHEAGLHAILEIDVIDGEEDLQALLEQCGLESSQRQQVTLWLPDYEHIYRLYQGWLKRPQRISYRLFPMSLRMVFSRATVIG